MGHSLFVSTATDTAPINGTTCTVAQGSFVWDTGPWVHIWMLRARRFARDAIQSIPQECFSCRLREESCCAACSWRFWLWLCMLSKCVENAHTCRHLQGLKIHATVCITCVSWYAFLCGDDVKLCAPAAASTHGHSHQSVFQCASGHTR